MSELRTPPTFEARRAQMADVVNYVMNNHNDTGFRIGWSLGGYRSVNIDGEDYNPFYPESITSVRKAASIGLAATTKKEILDQAKRYMQIKIPNDEERTAYAETAIISIKTLINKAGPAYITPTMDFKKQFAMQFAKLELLSNTGGLERTNVEMQGMVRPFQERLKFVAGLTGIIMTEVDEMFAHYPSPQRLPRAHTSVDDILALLDDLGIH